MERVRASVKDYGMRTLSVAVALNILALHAQVPGPVLPKIMARQVMIETPEMEDDFFPKGPATVCLEGPPLRQCYTAPKDFGRFPEVEIVRLGNGASGLLFSAATGGVSGWSIHYALLKPGKDKKLENLLPFELAVSNQSEHAFWNEPSISSEPIFLTATYVWGPEESHYSNHRFIISAYVLSHNRELDTTDYHLDDQFMTVKFYESKDHMDVLESEKTEILSRLKKVKASRQ